MDLRAMSLAIGREMVRLDAAGEPLPEMEEIGRMVRPDFEGRRARSLERVIARLIGEETGDVYSLQELAAKLGVSTEVFIGWTEGTSTS
jgi:hypothetical protein